MDQGHMKVSVIIPVYKDWDCLRLCLDALSSQTYPLSSTEILVVNNDAKEAVPADLQAPSSCSILYESAPGAYAARNRGLSEAKGELICFTDADCRPSADWLARIVDVFQNREDVDILGGQIRVDASLKSKRLVDVYELLYSFRQEEYVVIKSFAATANMSARRKVFDSAGGFDASLFSGGDKDWGVRAVSNGFTIEYSDKPSVTHPVRTVPELLRKIRRLTGGRLEKKVRKDGLARCRLSYLVALPFKILPPTGVVKSLYLQKGISRVMRLKVYGFLYLIKLIKAYERGCILLFKSDPERK